MKILFVDNASWSLWNFRGSLLRRLRHVGHEVVAATPSDWASQHLEGHFPYFGVSSLSRKGLNPFVDLGLCIELARLYGRVRPDLVVHYTIKPNVFGAIAARIRGRKSVIVVAGMGFTFRRKGLLRTIAMLLYRVGCACSAKVLFLNAQDLQDFTKFGILPKESDKAALLPGEGIDLERFRPPSGFVFRGAGEGDFIFVGRFLKDKGIEGYIDAARRLKAKRSGARFFLLGSVDPGNPMSVTEEYVRVAVAEGAVIHLPQTEDVRPHIGAVDALIVPTSYGEGLSRVVLEACAMGKPVLASDNRGCLPLVAEGENGFLHRMGDLEGLVGTIERFLALDGDARKRLGESSRRRVESGFGDAHVFNAFTAACSIPVRPPAPA